MIEAKYRINSPAFIHGHDPKGIAELRPPSIKGALRYWWRAVNWPRIRKAQGDNDKALQALWQEEGRIWGTVGSTEGKKLAGGQGVFVFGMPNAAQVSHIRLADLRGMDYLMGQGLKESGDPLAPASEFSLTLAYSARQVNEADKAGVILALRAMGLLGGIGSRSRKGFGSLQLTELTVDGNRIALGQPAGEARFISEHSQMAAETGEAPFTALTKSSEFFAKELETNDILHALRNVSEKLRRYRASKQAGGYGLFDDDTRLMAAASEGQIPAKMPRRAVFGLPHGYYFRETRKGARVEHPLDRSESRRASPLFLNFQKDVNTGKIVVVAALVPAKFSESGKVTIKGQQRATVAAQPDYDVIRKFLTGTEHLGARRIA
jgi:CRISPR-associated protein Cmr1